MTKRILTYLTSMLLAASLGTFLQAAPAQATECFTHDCGGEVWNNAPSGSIVITNCWSDSYGEWKVATTLGCQTKGDNRYAWPARTTMPRAMYSGDWSNQNGKIWYGDVDGIRFQAGCDTTYKFSTTGDLVERRKGLSTHVWRKIGYFDEVEIKSISC